MTAREPSEEVAPTGRTVGRPGDGRRSRRSGRPVVQPVGCRRGACRDTDRGSGRQPTRHFSDAAPAESSAGRQRRSPTFLPIQFPSPKRRRSLFPTDPPFIELPPVTLPPSTSRAAIAPRVFVADILEDVPLPSVEGPHEPRSRSRRRADLVLGRGVRRPRVRRLATNQHSRRDRRRRACRRRAHATIHAAGRPP